MKDWVYQRRDRILCECDIMMMDRTELEYEAAVADIFPPEP